MKWSKVSQTNKANYHKATKHYLNNIFLPFEVIKCNDTHCCDQKHLEFINKFYSDIAYSRLQPSKDVLESSFYRLSFHPILGWKNSVNWYLLEQELLIYLGLKKTYLKVMRF